MAQKILDCLEYTFEHEGVYYSGVDADTEHEEGAQYLWDEKELKDVLTPLELAQFKEIYQISGKGNFINKNHLIKKADRMLPDAEHKLLIARRKRKQPFVDRKISTSWNCLTGIGLVQAFVNLKDKRAILKAENLYNRLINLNSLGGRIYHSSFNSIRQNEEFLEDYASVLLFLTYLFKETNRYGDEMNRIYEKLKQYKGPDGWNESRNEDFLKVPAEAFDNPTPSSISMAELAILRTDFLNNRKISPKEYGQPLMNDFFNISSLVSNELIRMKEPSRK